eukprot:656459-Prorocentrum_minimum.AAC.2
MGRGGAAPCLQSLRTLLTAVGGTERRRRTLPTEPRNTSPAMLGPCKANSARTLHTPPPVNSSRRWCSSRLAGGDSTCEQAALRRSGGDLSVKSRRP